MNNGFQRRALFTERLGAIGILPDTGLTQLQLYFCEPVLAVSEVKDTP